MINKRSRYAKTGTVEVSDAAGQARELVDLRVVADADAVLEIVPRPGERLDHLAHRYYRDPTRFWRIADAADALDPFDAVVPGEALAIPPRR
ncbi:hypothetical protein G6O69_04275 [Pseudenhygromyxa sp. WMMC2535]|uniref:hypothetical protein n=1 Tax=Pseudenhygromyxa sp. WMMC2535 TaxID=2712867 RepID=UPI001555C3CE|nr:hypothetical protein [Pseudenhygromyxa sp. WMMC2535]NVB37034.1 hypothetical protein [Pseudenhygromyxa sp. WMMC2535]